MFRACAIAAMTFLSAGLGLATQAAAQQRNVLLLSETSSGVAGEIVVSNIQRSLARGLDERVEYYSEALDFSRFGPSYDTLALNFLAQKYSTIRLDAVITLGPEPLAFYQRHREVLFPDVPLVFLAVRPESLPGGSLPERATGVYGSFDIVSTLELALALQPTARRVVVLRGATSLGVQWEAFARRRLEPYADRLAISYLSGEPIPAVLDAVANLPRDTIVILLSMQRDGAGNNFFASRDLVGPISAASSAPLYGVYETYLGNGTVGGFVEGFEEFGAQAGALLQRVLSEDGAAVPPVQRAEGQYVVDARELRRWGLDESRLPPGTVVAFREPSIWDQYRVQILGIIALIALQTLVIVALLLRARQRRAEQALRRTEDRYRNVVETQTDLVCRYRPDTTLTFVNDAYCRAFGRTSEELLGTKFIDLLPEGDRPGALSHVESLLANPRTESNLHQIERTDGSVGWQQWLEHAIVEPDGAVVEIQGIGRDVTDLKRAEEEARLQREQVAHLTRVAILGELSGAVAHELNQPLTAILSNAQSAEYLLAQNDVDMAEIREIIKDIVADDLRAGEVIARLRAMLKKGTPELELLDISDLAADVLALARGQLVERHVRVTADLTPELPRVRGDRVQLQQVLLNLLMNATEAMISNPVDDRTLVIATGSRDGALVVSVIDNGGGVPSDARDRLFEPFFTTKENGLGLGLAICRSIVAGHGGCLWAGDNAGRGATFSFSLPLTHADRRSDAEPSDEQPPGQVA